MNKSRDADPWGGRMARGRGNIIFSWYDRVRSRLRGTPLNLSWKKGYAFWGWGKTHFRTISWRRVAQTWDDVGFFMIRLATATSTLSGPNSMLKCFAASDAYFRVLWKLVNRLEWVYRRSKLTKTCYTDLEILLNSECADATWAASAYSWPSLKEGR